MRICRSVDGSATAATETLTVAELSALARSRVCDCTEAAISSVLAADCDGAVAVAVNTA